jgi:predicted aldo/keto reductase-like oxidoreductase
VPVGRHGHWLVRAWLLDCIIATEGQQMKRTRRAENPPSDRDRPDPEPKRDDDAPDTPPTEPARPPVEEPPRAPGDRGPYVVRTSRRSTERLLSNSSVPRDSADSASSAPPRAPIERRPFGRHRDMVSILGVGGYHLSMAKSAADAVRIVHRAIDAGVNFLDNAWEYHEGESERRMGRAIEDRRDSVFLMTKVCTHGRDAKVAMRQLEDSLRRLRTDFLDLWQIHECVYYNDPERHFAKGGVVEALERAKAQGKVRYVGFTGHKDPEIHLRMLSFGFPFDACQLPLNGFDASFRSFQARVLPELARRQIAAIGMKSLGGDGRVVKKKESDVGAALRYAMSLPVCTIVSGVDSLKVLSQNLRIARSFSPMNATERRAYERRLVGQAIDGRFELYKTTAEHEGKVGRRQHGFPSQEELAL